MSGRDFFSDSFKHTTEIIHHVTIPEADDAIAMPGDVGCACGVRPWLQCMLTAIKLDRELDAGTSEIDDMATDRVLSTKAVPAGKFAQSSPELLLNLRRIATQLPSNRRPSP